MYPRGYTPSHEWSPHIFYCVWAPFHMRGCKPVCAWLCTRSITRHCLCCTLRMESGVDLVNFYLFICLFVCFSLIKFINISRNLLILAFLICLILDSWKFEITFPCESCVTMQFVICFNLTCLTTTIYEKWVLNSDF